MTPAYPLPTRAAIFGASGGIGRALVTALADQPQMEAVHAVARSGGEGAPKVTPHLYDPSSEESLAAIAATLADEPLDLIIVATGTLHSATFGPEKSFRDFDEASFLEVMRINAALPGLIAKHMLPALKRRKRTVFAALSARVGSISDNGLGGWHAYRASKAALNMLLRNLSIEVARTNKDAVVVGLHPGTVETALSAPFQKGVPAGKFFTPAFSATAMLEVVRTRGPEDSGKCLDYAGKEIAP